MSTTGAYVQRVLAAMAVRKHAEAGVRGASESGLRTIRGRIDTTGSGTILQGAESFSIVRNGTGDVTITFTTPFGDVPSCVPAGEHATAWAHAKVKGVPTTTAVQVQYFQTANTGTVDETHQSADGIINFVVVGPRV